MKKDDFADSGIYECLNYPYVHHIIDATVLEIHHPSGFLADAKPYFSGVFFCNYFLTYFFLITSTNHCSNCV